MDNTEIGNFRAERSAHELRTRNQSDSTQIESICIPTRADGRVVVAITIRVPNAGVLKQVEILIRQLEALTSQARGVVSASFSVTRVPSIVQASAIVEDGEQPDDVNLCPGARCQNQPIPFDSAPVIGAMNRKWIAVGPRGYHIRPETFKIDQSIGHVAVFIYRTPLNEKCGIDAG